MQPALQLLLRNRKRGAYAPGSGGAAWYEAASYDPLASVMDFNNDRYSLPAFGTEQVINGNFSTAATYDSELIVNGGFADGTGWTLKTPVGAETNVISGGVLTMTGDGTNAAYARQAITTEVGASYEVTFTVATNACNLSIGTTNGGTQLLNFAIFPTGSHSFRLIPTTTTTHFNFSRTTASASVLDNVSVRKVTNPAAYYGNTDSAGIQEYYGIANGRVRIFNGTANEGYVGFDFAGTAGSLYQITYTSYGRDGGANATAVSVGGAATLLARVAVTAPGAGLSSAQTIFVTATVAGTYRLELRSGAGGSSNYAEFDNVSIKEVILTATGRTYGSELVVNGDFATDITLGSELLDNGDFAGAAVADPSLGWVLNTIVGTESRSISGGLLNLTGDGTNTAYADQSFVTTNGEWYQLSWHSASGFGGPNIGTSQGGSQIAALSSPLSTAQVYRFRAQGALTWIRFAKQSGGTGTYDNVSIKEITNRAAVGWLPTMGGFISGSTTVGAATISSGTLNLTGDGTNAAYADQSFTTVASTVYELTYTIGGTGTANVTLGTAQSGNSIMANTTALGTIGTQTVKFVATGTTTWIRFRKDAATLSTVDNVSIRALTAIGTYPKREATFDECFAYTAASDSARTYVDSGGTLRTMTYGRTNLALYGSDQSNAAWLGYASGTGSASRTGASGTAPDGTNTATLVTINRSNTLSWAAGLSISFNGTVASYTGSIYVKAYEPADVGRTFNLLFWSSGGSNGLAMVPVTLTADWQRITTTATLTASSFAMMVGYISSDAVGTVGRETTTGQTRFLSWGGQVEPHSSVSTYVPTTTAAITAGVNARRMTYANAKRQLRLENAGTNLCLQSEDLATGWSLAAASLTSNNATAPAGTATADTVVEDGANNVHGISAANVTKAASAIQYTWSVFVKRGTGTRNLYLTADGGSSANRGDVIIDLSNGTVLVAPSVAGTFTSPSAAVTTHGSFYRVALTVTTGTETVIRGRVFLANGTLGSAGYVGDSTSSIIVWGAQLEASAFATDYIPTTSAAVTRAIETARLSPLLEAVLQRAQGSVVTRFDLSAPNATSRRVVGMDTTTGFGLASSGGASYSTTNGTVSLVSTLGSGTNVDAMGGATGFDASGRSIVSNGGTVASDANSIGTRTTIYLGRDATNTAGTFGDGYYDLVGFSPERLPNTNLQALAVAAT